MDEIFESYLNSLSPADRQAFIAGFTKTISRDTYQNGTPDHRREERLRVYQQALPKIATTIGRDDLTADTNMVASYNRFIDKLESSLPGVQPQQESKKKSAWLAQMESMLPEQSGLQTSPLPAGSLGIVEEPVDISSEPSPNGGAAVQEKTEIGKLLEPFTKPLTIPAAEAIQPQTDTERRVKELERIREATSPTQQLITQAKMQAATSQMNADKAISEENPLIKGMAQATNWLGKQSVALQERYGIQTSEKRPEEYTGTQIKSGLDAQQRYEELKQQLQMLKEQAPESLDIAAIEQQMRQQKQIMNANGVGMLLVDSSAPGGKRHFTYEDIVPVDINNPEGEQINVAQLVKENIPKYKDPNVGTFMESMRALEIKSRWQNQQMQEQQDTVLAAQRGIPETSGSMMVETMRTPFAGELNQQEEYQKKVQEERSADWNELLNATPDQLIEIVKAPTSLINSLETVHRAKFAREINNTKVEGRYDWAPDVIANNILIPADSAVLGVGKGTGQAAADIMQGTGLLYDYIFDSDDNKIDNQLFAAGEELEKEIQGIPTYQYGNKIKDFWANDVTQGTGNMLTLFIPAAAASKAMGALGVAGKGTALGAAIANNTSRAASLTMGYMGGMAAVGAEIEPMLKAVDEGAIDPDTGKPVRMDDVYAASAIIFAGNGILERVGAGKILSYGNKVLSKEAKDQIVNKAFYGLRQMGEAGLAEGSTEMLQNTLTTLTAQQYYDFTRELEGEDLLRDGAAGLVIGFFMSGARPKVNSQQDIDVVETAINDLLSKADFPKVEEALIREKAAADIEKMRLPKDEQMALAKTTPEVIDILNLDEYQQEQFKREREQLLTEGNALTAQEMLRDPGVEARMNLSEDQKKLIADASEIDPASIELNVQDSPLMQENPYAATLLETHTARDAGDVLNLSEEQVSELESIKESSGKDIMELLSDPTVQNELALDRKQIKTVEDAVYKDPWSVVPDEERPKLSEQERITTDKAPIKATEGETILTELATPLTEGELSPQEQAIEQQDKPTEVIDQDFVDIRRRILQPDEAYAINSIMKTMEESPRGEDITIEEGSIIPGMNRIWNTEREVANKVYGYAAKLGLDVPTIVRKMATTNVDNWRRVGRTLDRLLPRSTSKRAKNALGRIARLPAQTLISLSKNLPRSQELVSAADRFKGSFSDASRTSYLLGRDLYKAIGNNPTVMANVTAAMDPTFALLAPEAYSVSYNALSQEQQAELDPILKDYIRFTELDAYARKLYKTAYNLEGEIRGASLPEVIRIAEDNGITVTPFMDGDAMRGIIMDRKIYSSPKEIAQKITSKYLEGKGDTYANYDKKGKPWLNAPQEIADFIAQIASEMPTVNSLSTADGSRQLYDVLRDTLDYIHEENHRMGFITDEVYSKYKGTYSPRMYINMEMPDLMNFEDVYNMSEEEFFSKYNTTMNQFARTQMGIDGYQMRKDLADISSKALLDPIYATMRRLTSMERNKAVYNYAETLLNKGIAKSPAEIATEEEVTAWGNQPPKKYKGYVRLESKQLGKMRYEPYGPITGMYVPSDIATDFDGYQFYTALGDGMMNMFNFFSRPSSVPGAINTFYKMFHTVLNPTMYPMNYLTNGAFAIFSGTNPLTMARWQPLAQSMMRDATPNKLIWRGARNIKIPTTSIKSSIFDVLRIPKDIIPADPEARKALEVQLKQDLYKEIAQYGLVATDVVTEEFRQLSAEALQRTSTPYGKKMMKAEQQRGTWMEENIKDLESKAKGVKEVALELYQATDDINKISAFLTKLNDNLSKYKGKSYGQQDLKKAMDRAARDVAEGFQNTNRVGMAWHVASRTPLVGNPYVKFKGDMLRIMGNAYKNHPLTSAALIYAAWPALRYAFDDKDMTEDEKKLLDESGYQKTLWPISTEPLVITIGKDQVDISRWISPYSHFSKGDIEGSDDFLESLTEFALPFNYDKDTILKFQDFLFTPGVQYFIDKDFRGRSIREPRKRDYMSGSLSTTSQEERTENATTFLMRAYIPWYSTYNDWTRVVEDGEDYFGRRLTPYQMALRKLGIKVTKYDTNTEGYKIFKNRINKEIYNVRQAQADMKARLREVKNTIRSVSSIEGLSEQQCIDKINKELYGFGQVLHERMGEIKKALGKIVYLESNYGHLFEDGEAESRMAEELSRMEENMDRILSSEEMGKSIQDIVNIAEDESVQIEKMLEDVDDANQTLELESGK